MDAGGSRHRELTHRYFFILYVPMLFRTASILFGTVLRAAGDTKTPMRVGVLMNLINIVLNFLLIYPSREISLFSHRVSVYGAGWGWRARPSPAPFPTRSAAC